MHQPSSARRHTSYAPGPTPGRARSESAPHRPEPAGKGGVDLRGNAAAQPRGPQGPGRDRRSRCAHEDGEATRGRRSGSTAKKGSPRVQHPRWRAGRVGAPARRARWRRCRSPKARHWHQRTLSAGAGRQRCCPRPPLMAGHGVSGGERGVGWGSCMHWRTTGMRPKRARAQEGEDSDRRGGRCGGYGFRNGGPAGNALTEGRCLSVLLSSGPVRPRRRTGPWTAGPRRATDSDGFGRNASELRVARSLEGCLRPGLSVITSCLAIRLRITVT